MSKTKLWHVSHKWDKGLVVLVKSTPFSGSIPFRTITPRAAARRYIKYNLFDTLAKTEIADRTWLGPMYFDAGEFVPEIIAQRKKERKFYRNQIKIVIEK